MVQYAATIDVRQFSSRVKHSTILGVLNALDVGTTMLLMNDHDPKPLFYQLSAEYPNQYEWNYVENGPERWQVEIKRVALG